MAVESQMVPLGTPAPDFSLPSITGDKVSLSDLDGAPAVVVAFVCNHCPYVKHVEGRLGELASELETEGVRFVGICSNDTEAYPDDDVDGLRAQAERAGWSFPYLVDADGSVGRAYHAACTPDFFVYGPDLTLRYRGAMDAASPGNDVPVTGQELAKAIELVLRGEDVPEPHRPSMGCSIKWPDGG